MIRILVLTDFSSSYGRDLLRGIVRYSQQVGGWAFYRVPLSYRILHGDSGVVELAKKWQVDAVIAQLEGLDLNLLSDLKLPIIVQNYTDRLPGLCNLTGEYIETGIMAADYFLRKGFQHFAYYGINDTVWARERKKGFCERLASEGYPVHRFIEQSPGNDQWNYNADTLEQWLHTLPKPIGLFACDDYYALSISETCKIAGILIPDEVAILGVDNDALLCNIASPPLSSILLDVENGGYLAGQMLNQLIHKNIPTPIDISVKAIQVVERQSTLYYAIEDKAILQVVEYIERHYSNAIVFAELLAAVPLSRRVLEKRFKQATGMTLYSFIQHHRIECFARKLLSTSLSVQEIAYQCGFDDGKNVARVFAQFKNMTPSQYRRKYRHTRV